MNLPRLLRYSLLALASGLSGCGGGGGGGGSAGEPVTHAQLSVGDRWIYDVTFKNRSGATSTSQQTVTIGGTLRVGDIDAAVELTRDTTTSELLNGRLLHQTDSLMSEVFMPGESPFDSDLESIPLMQFPLVGGKNFEAARWMDLDTGVDVDYDGKNERADVIEKVSVGARYRVETPAGIFEGATLVTTTTTSTYLFTASGRKAQVITRYERWMVEDVGVVKAISTTTHSDNTTEKFTYLLNSYVVDGLRSEDNPPEIAAEFPATSSVDNAWPTIAVTTDEILDLERLDNITVTVRNSSDQPVPGRVTVDIRGLNFIYTTPLLPDTYTVRVAGAVDLLGNEMLPSEFSFTVDITAPGDPRNYQPLSVGNRWIYDVTVSGDGIPWHQSEVMETIAGTRMVSGIEALVKERRVPTTNELLSTSYAHKTEYAVHQIFEEGLAPFGLPMNATVEFRLPFIPNDTYETRYYQGLDSGHDYDGDGINETVNSTIKTTVGTPHSVTVSAGAFSDVLPVYTTITTDYISSRTGLAETFTTRAVEHIAPQIGVILRNYTFESAEGSENRYETLKSYSIGTLRSESTPPWLMSIDPSGSGTFQPVTEVTFNFTSGLDIGRVDNSDILVTDNLGRTISGTVSADSSHIRFTPDQPFADGRYTVRLLEASDLLGNVFGTETTFSIDGTPPEVLSVTPDDGTTDVDRMPTFEVTFSEPVYVWGGYGYNGAIAITGGPTPINSLRTEMSGNTLTFTPSSTYQRLAHGTLYTVTFSTDFRDAAGNRLARPYTFSFTTVQPLLVPATVTAPGATVTANAIGDINGDGRDDLVTLTNAGEMIVYRQGADGALTVAMRRSTAYVADLSCRPTAVAIGDVTGDGSADIVVGENGCGLRIFERIPGRGWVLPARIVTADSNLVQIADMNRDGRLDLVTAGGGTSIVSVRYQQATGGLGAPVAIGASTDAIADIALGDVSNDGINDIVACAAGDVVVMKGLSAGGFGPATRRSSGEFHYATAVAIGDLNSDGLNDVLASVGSRPFLVIYPQQNDHTLGAPVLYSAEVGDVAVADINKDGRLDVLLAHTSENELGVFLQKEDGSLAIEDLHTAASIWNNRQALAIGDLNNDGFTDAVTGSFNFSVMMNVGN